MTPRAQLVPTGTSVVTPFFDNRTATTELYTLSLHDALPICRGRRHRGRRPVGGNRGADREHREHRGGENQTADRKSTRLNSSHVSSSYAVFCLKKKTASPPGQRCGEDGRVADQRVVAEVVLG